MQVGDSITQGFGCPALAVTSMSDGWRQSTWNRAEAARKQITFVGPFANGNPDTGGRHEGVGGSTIGDHLAGLAAYLATYNPSVVTVMLGTNNAHAVLVDQVTADYTSLMNIIRSYSATVPIAACLPISITDPTRTPYIDSVRSQETAVVNSMISGGDAHIVLIDTSALSTDQLNTDGVHPTCTGYVTLGNIIWNGGLSALL